MSFKIKKKKLDLPGISMIIPIKDQLQYLDKCLSSLEKVEDVNFELILVNDGSNAETVHYLERFPQLNVIHSSVSEGFISACHKGAKKSVGEYLLFLNSDTEIIEKKFFRYMLLIFKHNKYGWAFSTKLSYTNDT